MKALFLAASLLLCSCVGNRWDTYDSSIHDVLMEPSSEQVAEHIELLTSWISDEGQEVPPGIYAELGYWLAKVGRYEEARTAFQQELQRYPRSEKYLAVLGSLVLPEGTSMEASADSLARPEVKP